MGLLRPVVVCLLFSLPAPVLAQILTGNILGTIRDESGAVLPGATVTVSSPARPAGTSVVTDTSGEYRFVGLPPGIYTLSVALDGFSRYEETELRVTVGGTIERIVPLKLASVSESITVSGASPVIDTRRSGLQTNLPAEAIEQVPTRRFSVFDYFKWAPGVYSDPNARSTTMSVMGSGGSENLTQLDGLNINYATGGGNNQYPDPDIVQEVEVISVGASVEYQQAQGAVFQIVTKSGTNIFKYDGAGFWQPDGFTSKPIKLACSTCPERESGFARTKYVDYTVHAGGPISRDRVWFYGGAAFHDEWTSQPGTDPTTPQKYRDYNPFAKVTWQISDQVRFFQTYDDDFWLIPGTPTIARPPSTLTEQGGNNPGFASEVNAQLTNAIYMNAQVAGWWFDGWKTRPVGGDLVTPNRTDELTGYQTGGASSINNSYSNRWDVRWKLGYYRQGWLGADHDMKTGLQFNHGIDSDRSSYVGGVNYTDLGGAPDEATYRTPWVSGGQTRGWAAFVEDQINIKSRLTISAGFRFDHITAMSPDLPASNDKLEATGQIVNGLEQTYPWRLLTPRVGFNLKVTDDAKTIVRGSYARSYRGLFAGELDAVHPGHSPTVLRAYNPATRDYTTLVSVTDPLVNLAVDPNTEAPLTDQYSVGFDRDLGRGLGINVTYVRKNADKQIGWMDIGGVYGTQTVVLANGQSLVVYPLLNSPAQRKFQLTNRPGYFSRYDGVVTSVQRRFADRWQASVSYTYSIQEGLVLTGTNGRDPNDLINADGRLSSDRPHVLKLQGSVEIPKVDVLIASSFTGQTGPPFATQASIRLPQGTRSINIEKAGEHRYSAQRFLNMRVTKFVRLGQDRKVEFVVDVQNALQNKAYTSVVTRNLFSATFGVPSVYTEPRRLLLGAKFAW